MQIEERVRELEAQIRQYRMRLTALAAFTLALGVVMVAVLRGDSTPPSGPATSPLGVLKGTSLELATDNGRIWLTANPLPTGGVLFLHSAGAYNGVQIRAEDGQIIVGLHAGEIFPYCLLGLRDNDSPSLMMTRPDLTNSVMIGEHPDKHGFVALFDARHKQILRYPENTRWPLTDTSDEDD